MNKRLIELVKKALDKVYQEQYYLIENEVHERSIVFWFGIYFYELLKNSEFKDYDLDFEYNRNFDNVKGTENFEKTYPDIILHKRGSDKDNLLIIEFKTWWNNKEKDKNKDIMKLKDFINSSGKYKYKNALFIIFNKDDKPEIEPVV